MSKFIRRRSLPRLLGLGLASAMAFASMAGSGASAAEPEKPAASARTNPALHERLPAENRERLAFATDPQFPPAVFFDEKNELQGYIVDYVRAIGEKLGVPIEIIYTKFDTLIPGLQAKRFDASFATDTAERRKIVTFVNYIANGISVALPKGNPKKLDLHNLCGMSVAVAVGTTHQLKVLPALQQECAAAGKPAIQESVFPGSNEAVVALQIGRADAFIADASFVAYLLFKNGNDFEAGATADTLGLGGFTFINGNPLIEVWADAAAEVIKDGTYAEIMKKWNLSAMEVPHPFINDDPVQ